MATLTDPYLNDVRLRIAITMGWFGDPVLEKPENADEIAKRVAKAGNILTDSERDTFLLAYRPGLDWDDVTNSYNSQRGGAAKRQTVMHHAASAERNNQSDCQSRILGIRCGFVFLAHATIQSRQEITGLSGNNNFFKQASFFLFKCGGAGAAKRDRLRQVLVLRAER